MNAIFDMTDELNSIIGAIITGIVILVLLYAVAKYLLKELKEDGLTHGIYLSAIYALEVAFVAGIFWGLPYLLEKYIPVKELARWIRWGEILIWGHFYFKSKKHAERRGYFSFYGHYVLFLFAWFIDRWFGMIMIAFPLLFIYYYVMSRVASEIMPASNPEDRKEQYARFKVFLSYTWGLQQPLWKAASNTAGEAEKRIDGASCPIKFAGMIWTYPHQVIGIAEGPKFSVDGPGLIFIGKGKQPFDIVDLRDQMCSSIIKAISRDGISFEATVTVVFRVDYETWTKDQHQELRRANTLLRDGMEPDRNLAGTFPYSQARVKSVLSYRSRKATVDGEDTERWHNHVLGMAEQTAREALAERSIEDLWRAHENENSSAAEEITSEMKRLITDRLRINGIQLINAKAAKFLFKDGGIDEKDKDDVSEQQLATWSVEWERRRSMTLANGQAESERLQQEARAYAHSILLTAIAEGLQQARSIHPNLPRYVIAMRFIGALEEMIEQQPETDEKENLKARANIRKAKAHFLSKSRGE